MARIDDAIRPKRFRVLEDATLVLQIETTNATRVDLRVLDASVSGLAVLGALEAQSDLQNELQPGTIIPDSRLSWNNNNHTLGRLVVRRVQLEANSIIIGLTCIDSKVPLSGSLSKCFAELGSGSDSPFDFELGAKKFNLATFIETEFTHPDLFEKCRQYKFLQGDLKKSPIYQYYSIKQNVLGSRAKYKILRTKKSVDCISFAGYDYLGFSDHPEVTEAAKKAIDAFGMSAAGSMILGGKTSLHEELENKIADYFNKDDALLFNSGYSTNVGLVTGLARKSDLIVADIYAHASLSDGISASGAKARFFKHNNMTNLENILKENRNAHNGCLLITEGLFSMEGSIPDLKSFIDIAKQNNARTFIDECHSIGVFGETGRGISEEQGVLEDVDLYMATLSKGLGSGCGGFITGSKEVIEWLRFFSRPGMFSVAPPPAVVGACLKVFELMEKMPERRHKILENTQRFRAGLRRIGLDSPAHANSPIIPVVVGDQEVLAKMNQVLLDSGIFVNCILYPAVPINSARFRFSITAKHSLSDIDLAIAALEKAFSQIKLTALTKEINEVKNEIKNFKPKLKNSA